MKSFHPFYTIGTLGLIIVATLHIGLALFVIESPNHAAFLGAYPIWIVFLILGTVLTVKQQKTVKTQS